MEFIERRGVKMTTAMDMWERISDPSEADIENLAKKYGMPKYYFEGVTDLDEPARIERMKEGLFIIVDFPYVKRTENNLSLYDTFPISIIISKEKLVTITAAHHDFLDEFRVRYSAETDEPHRSGMMALHLFHYIIENYIRNLRTIREELTNTEERFLKKVYNDDFRRLFTLEKSLIHFKTALTSFGSMLDKLAERKYLKIEMLTEMELLFDNVQIETKQANEMASIYREVLSSAMDVASSLVSNTLNQIMKRLTSITIIISVPTLITSFYGMNVGLPFQDLPLAILIIVLISIILSYITVVFLRSKDLL